MTVGSCEFESHLLHNKLKSVNVTKRGIFVPANGKVYFHAMSAAENAEFCETKRGNSSVGRAQPCQGWGREFESRLPLYRNEQDIVPAFFLKAL